MIRRPNRGPRPASRVARTLPHWGLLAGLALSLAFGVSAPSAASEARNFSLFGSAGLGGPLDAEEPDPGLGNTSFQLGFSWVTEPQTRVGVRLGSADLGDAIEQVADPTLDWVTIGGEYRYSESFFESGLYLGLGYYRLDGIVEGRSDDETAVGLVLGATGEFPINPTFSVVGELSVHWVDLDRVGQVFGFFHAGLAVNF